MKKKGNKKMPTPRLLTVPALMRSYLPIPTSLFCCFFCEMKGDVGMSLHEKGRKQEDTYTKTQSHS